MDIIGILVLVISFFFLLVVGVPVAYSIGVAGILTMLVNIDSASRPYDLCDAYGFGSGQFRSVGDPVFYIGGEYHE